MRANKRKVLLAMSMSVIAVVLSGCGTSAVRSVSGLNGLLGEDLVSARGATREDQRKIDVTLERGIRSGIWNRPR